MGMTRITLNNKARQISMKVDVPEEGDVDEINGMASDYWGESFILRRGYELLSPRGRVGESFTEGDEVDLIPDPDMDKYGGGDVRACLEGWLQRRRS